MLSGDTDVYFISISQSPYEVLTIIPWYKQINMNLCISKISQQKNAERNKNFNLFFFYWSIVALHCCVSFCSSKVNQPYTYIQLFFFGFPSHLGHHSALSRVPCVTQQILISYLFYTQQCIYVNPNLPIHPTPPSPLVSIHLFSTSVSLFLLCK